MEARGWVALSCCVSAARRGFAAREIETH